MDPNHPESAVDINFGGKRGHYLADRATTTDPPSTVAGYYRNVPPWIEDQGFEHGIRFSDSQTPGCSRVITLRHADQGTEITYEVVYSDSLRKGANPR